MILEENDDGWWTVIDERSGIVRPRSQSAAALEDLDEAIALLDDVEANDDSTPVHSGSTGSRGLAGLSGRDVVSILDRTGYDVVRQRGTSLKYAHPDTGKIRIVSVPMRDRIRTGALQETVEQCGADDFDAWCR